MKKFLHNIAVLLALFLLPFSSISQTAVPLGAASPFVLYSVSGPVGNTGVSLVTGDVGTNGSTSTGFGNINGSFHDADPASIAAMAPVNAAYISMGLQATTHAMPVLIGSGQTLVPGVHESLALTTLNGNLFLDGLNDPNSVFVIKVNAAMNVGTGARIFLLNGAQSCNVFWKIGGALNTLPGAHLVGTFVCDGAIGLTTGSKIDGRLLSISGAIQVASTVATAPRGCGSPVLTGPLLPTLGAAECFSLLTGIGQLTNTGITHVDGHIGTQNGPLTGFNPLFVDSIHAVPDIMTFNGTAAILNLYNTLKAMPCEITLTQPSQFGRSQVLTPHVYCLKAATQMLDTIFLDAQGNADAVFVIRIEGAFTTATFSNVVLRGGAKSSNVFWAVNGLVDVLANSNFIGNIVDSSGAINLIDINFEGRAYTVEGAIIVSDLDLKLPSLKPAIAVTGSLVFCEGDSAVLTASVSANYLWSTGETTQSIVVDTAGAYSVITTSDCNSVDTSLIVNIIVNPSSTTNLNASICNGDSILIAGIYRKDAGIYSDSLTNSFGCDSIINTNLLINPIFNTNLNASICEGDSILIAGIYRKIAGVYNQTLTSQFGCDSTVSTSLSLNPVFNTNSNASICEGDSILIAGIYRKIAGLYTDSLSSQFGCDSIISINLSINPTIVSNVNASICEGDSILINGIFRTLPGLYSDTLSSQFTCDSIVNTNLTVNPISITATFASICEGDSILIAGIYRKIQGIYADTLSNQLGCDSIINTNLSVNPIYTTNLNASICQGDSMLILGIYRKEAGVFSITINSSTTCDSTIITTLSVFDLPNADAGVDRTIFLGETAVIGVNAEQNTSYSWTPTNGLASSTSALTNASPLATTTYVVSATNTITGCVNTDTVLVVVNPIADLEFFNGFSPNGDGLNDYWRIPVLSLFTSNNVQILNRWGNEVWNTVDYNNVDKVFIGQNMNGDNLADGTYYYIIKYGNQELRGWLFIKR